MYGARPELAHASSGSTTSSGSCQPVGPPDREPDLLACEVSDAHVTWENTSVPATETFIRVIDTHDGHLVGEWRPGEDSSIGVLGQRILLAHWDAVGGVEVVAHQADSGVVAWTRHLDVPDGTAYRSALPTVQGVGSVVEVSSGSWVASLDDDGVPLAAQPEAGPTGGSTTWLIDAPDPDHLIAATVDADGRTAVDVLRGDGTLEHSLSGAIVGTAVDDGGPCRTCS